MISHNDPIRSAPYWRWFADANHGSYGVKKGDEVSKAVFAPDLSATLSRFPISDAITYNSGELGWHIAMVAAFSIGFRNRRGKKNEFGYFALAFDAEELVGEDGGDDDFWVVKCAVPYWLARGFNQWGRHEPLPDGTTPEALFDALLEGTDLPDLIDAIKVFYNETLPKIYRQCNPEKGQT